MAVRIPERLRGLLKEVIAKYHPEMAELLTPQGDISLNPQQLDALRNDAVGDELCETGFGSNGEPPNQRGLDLEELIDLLGHEMP